MLHDGNQGAIIIEAQEQGGRSTHLSLEGRAAQIKRLHPVRNGPCRTTCGVVERSPVSSVTRFAAHR